MKKTYIALGEDMDSLEKKLQENNIPMYRYKHINAIHIQTENQEELKKLIGEKYLLHENHTREANHDTE